MRSKRSLLVRLTIGLGLIAGLLASSLAASPASAGISPQCPSSVDTTPEGWVCLQYNLTLVRTPSDSEVAYWTGVHSTSGRPAVVNGITFAEEAASYYVTSLYDATLNRAPEPAALSAWAARIQSDRNEYAVLSPPPPPPEFLDLFATAEDYVNALYNVLLRRDADPDGDAYWAGQLDSGDLTVQELVAILAHSGEAGVVIAYSTLSLALMRQPDEGGMAFWSPKAAREGVFQTVAQVLVTDEAYNTLGAAGVCAAQSCTTSTQAPRQSILRVGTRG
jgi:hypothetical protein